MIRKRFDGGPRLVLKAAWWSKYMPHMARMIAHSRFIIIMRDPLDIVASHLDAGQRGAARSGHNAFPPEHVPIWASQVTEQYAAIYNNSELFGDRMRSIKYEDLMRGQIDLSILENFLALPDLPEVSGKHDSGLVNFEQSRDSDIYAELWGKKLSDSRIGRYKEILSATQIATVREVTGGLREQFGYD